MRRLLLLALLPGCFTGRPSALFGHEVRSEVQLAQLLDDMDDVKAKLDAPPPVRQLVPAGAAPVYRSPRNGRIHTRILYAGGHLKLVALPEQARDEVVLSVRPVAALDSTCAIRLYRDGERLDVGEHIRRSDHELLVSLSVTELGKSERFSGTACGQSFELDQAGRDTLASFVARVHERVDELSATASTGVADAR